MPRSSKYLRELQEFGGDPRTRRDLLRAVCRVLVRDGEHHLGAVSGPRAGVGERRQHLDVGRGLRDPVLPGDAHVEQAILHVERDLLGPQDRDALDPIVVHGAVIVAARAAAHAEVGGFEKAQCLLLEGALGDDELQHMNLVVGVRRECSPRRRTDSVGIMDRPTAAPQLDIQDLETRRKDLSVARFGLGYRIQEVDAFLDEALDAMRSLREENEGLRARSSPEDLSLGATETRQRLTPLDVQARVFESGRFGNGYKMRAVDEILDDVTDMLAALTAENEAIRGGRSTS
jgi:DivIVA domain-containing protein